MKSRSFPKQSQTVLIVDYHVHYMISQYVSNTYYWAENGQMQTYKTLFQGRKWSLLLEKM